MQPSYGPAVTIPVVAAPGSVNAVQDARPRSLGGLGWIIAAYLGGTAVAIILVGITGVATNSSPYNVLAFIGLWVGFIGVPLFLSRSRGTGKLSTDFGLRLGGPADVGLGLVAGLLSYGVVELYSVSIRAAGDHADLGHEATQLSGHGVGLGFIAFGLCAAVGAPIAEEVFFRGLAQPVLQRYLGGVGGLLATSVAFGFAHLGSNPIEAVLPLAFFGAVVGSLAWRTGRLGPGIVAHMTFNGITVMALASSR
jgi:membrane protease YdiL (CAAX protease family)